MHHDTRNWNDYYTSLFPLKMTEYHLNESMKKIISLTFSLSLLVLNHEEDDNEENVERTIFILYYCSQNRKRCDTLLMLTLHIGVKISFGFKENEKLL